jgi:hypothetical protein
MTAEQSRNLKVGQLVAWHDSATDLGAVRAVDWSGVQIAWATAKSSLHHNNMGELNPAKSLM